MVNSRSFLSEEFLAQYKDVRPRNAGRLFDVVIVRYLLQINEGGKWRLEKWWEACVRQVEYSMGLYSGHKTVEERIPEAQDMFDMMFHLESLPSGRATRIGGTEACEKYPESAFNCAFTDIQEIEDFCDAFHLSLCSAGVGFSILDELVARLPKLTSRFEVGHYKYDKESWVGFTGPRTERTEYKSYKDNHILQVGDSKDGWVQSLRTFLTVLTTPPTFRDKHFIDFDYSWVRPEGERLKTWGGRAAGPSGLKQMFEKLERTIKNSSEGKLRPIHCLDINNSIGANVVVGGTRRAAEIALFSPTNQECIEAKFGDKTGWMGHTDSKEKINYKLDYEAKYGKELAKEIYARDKYEGKIDWIPNPETDHRTMSNNSMVFESKPTMEKLTEIVQFIRFNGEPGIFNLEAAKTRRPNVSGLNPCSEILLASKGMCNLSSVSWPSHLIKEKDIYRVNYESLEKAYRNAVRIGARQTNVTLSLPEWDFVQKRDRLLGVSITGEMDALDRLGWQTNSKEHEDFLKWLRWVCHDETDKYASEMRIPKPLLTTCVKPEGSQSLLMTVSCGVHRSYSPFYIRRMKFASFEPICKALLDLNVPWEKDKSKKESNRLVFEFPIASGAKIAADDESFESQFQRYLLHQDKWTDHNTSISLYVGEDEWEKVPEALYKNWDKVIAVSFLPKGYKGTQLPYEAISEEEFNKRNETLPDLSKLCDIIDKYENGEQYEILDSACGSGACPIV